MVLNIVKVKNTDATKNNNKKLFSRIEYSLKISLHKKKHKQTGKDIRNKQKLLLLRKRNGTINKPAIDVPLIKLKQASILCAITCHDHRFNRIPKTWVNPNFL
ncbi:MAG: hypothetical protein AABY84_13110 [Candidatus Firestonebacteria bacterium]